MKYPINQFRMALREIYCWFFGHKWKYSWRRRADADFYSDYDTLSYAQRQSGNAYFEHSTGWHVKCRYCRRTERNDGWHPWYKDWYRAISSSIYSFFRAYKNKGMEIKVKSYFALVPFSFATALTQFFAYMLTDRNWPVFPLDWACTIEYWLMDRAFED